MGTVFKRLKSYRPNLSTGIALLALFIALGGTATAAIVIKSSKQLGKNVVTSSKIKNKTIRSADIRNGAISSKKLRRSTLNSLGVNSAPGPSGPAGPQGLPGADGVPGPQGREGPQGVPGNEGEGRPGVDGKDGKNGDSATLYAATINGNGEEVQVYKHKKLGQPNVVWVSPGKYKITLTGKKDPDVAAVLTTVQNPDAGPVAATVNNDAPKNKKVITLDAKGSVDTAFYVMLIGVEGL